METAAEITTTQGKLRLLSYNVQVGIPTSKYRHYFTKSWKHLLPFPERNRNLNRIADFIRDFDIVGLMELDAGSIRSEFINQPKYIADKAGFPYFYSKTNRDLGVFAQHSFAIFSRFEACEVREHILPSTIPGRGALEVHFGCNDERLVVILAHLSLLPGARRKQMRYLSGLVKQYKHAVVMGDFNTQLHDDVFDHLFCDTGLCKPSQAQHTFPSWKPRLGFDHIFVTPEIRTGEAEVYGVSYSDHLPVGVEVDRPFKLLSN